MPVDLGPGRSFESAVYRLLTDFVIIIHFVWIIFILFGFVLAWRYRKISYVHAAGLIFTFILNVAGWYCPLTHLEYYLKGYDHARSLNGGSFIANTLERLIYLRVNEFYLRIGAMAWAGLNLAGYAMLLKKKVKGGGTRTLP